MFKDIIFDNLENIIWVNKINSHLSDYEQKTSEGSIQDVATGGYITLDTSATSGNYAGIIESGNRIDFSAKSKWIMKGNCDSNTYLTVKLGVDVDHANDADTTNAQYGIDASDSVGSTRTWEIRSANHVSSIDV